MTKDIRQLGSLTETEQKQLLGWGEDIFGAAKFKLRWRHKDVNFVLTIDGEMLSRVGVVKHAVTVADQEITVGGVGGVVTVPAAQRHGYASELMHYTARFFANWGVDAGLLFCLPHRIAFYESLGWQLVRFPVVVQQPDGDIESPLEVMVLPIKAAWPEGPIQLNSLPW
jgi:GNAT superfamily N-acetyltransferase